MPGARCTPKSARLLHGLWVRALNEHFDQSKDVALLTREAMPQLSTWLHSEADRDRVTISGTASLDEQMPRDADDLMLHQIACQAAQAQERLAVEHNVRAGDRGTRCATSARHSRLRDTRAFR